MAKLHFKYTNKQRGLGCISVFFQVVLVVVSIGILINFKSFMEHSPIATPIVLIMTVLVFLPYFRKKGDKLKGDAVLTDSALIIGGTERFLLDDLYLDIYKENNLENYFMVYTRYKDFMLYTRSGDDLIEALKSRIVQKSEFKVKKYSFGESLIVQIKTTEGRIMSLHLESGRFELSEADSEDSKVYNPKLFIVSPEYRLKK